MLKVLHEWESVRDFYVPNLFHHLQLRTVSLCSLVGGKLSGRNYYSHLKGNWDTLFVACSTSTSSSQ